MRPTPYSLPEHRPTDQSLLSPLVGYSVLGRQVLDTTRGLHGRSLVPGDGLLSGEVIGRYYFFLTLAVGRVVAPEAGQAVRPTSAGTG